MLDAAIFMGEETSESKKICSMFKESFDNILRDCMIKRTFLLKQMACCLCVRFRICLCRDWQGLLIDMVSPSVW
jgi:hypothetical protein